MATRIPFASTSRANSASHRHTLKGRTAMKGSITYEFSGDPRDYRVHISREGELDCGDLEVIAALLQDDIKLRSSSRPARSKRLRRTLA